MEKSIPIAVVAVIISVISIISAVAAIALQPVLTIGTGDVGTDELANNSVTGDKIADGAVALTDLASDVIVTLENIADNSITSAKIADGAIMDPDVATDAAINPSKISGTAWTSTNDGSGSGLDADTVDGVSSTQFLRSDNSGTISGNLTVNGTVTTDNVVYSTPHTHYFVVGGDAFHPRGSGVAYTNGGGSGAYIHTGSNGTLSASVHLPHGAVVTAFSVYFNDTSASDLWVYLGRYALTDGGYATMASVVSQDVSGYGSKSTTSISESTINNTAYSYTVYASWGGDNNLSIMGALITYTTDAAL